MADQVLYQTRRTLDESSDKLEDDDVNPVKERLDELEKLSKMMMENHLI